MSERVYGFEPVWRADARLLILGSMPSAMSLKRDFYYAHPRNIFWPMLARILGAAVPESISERCALLKDNRIALWDSVQSCERVGSLDSAIRTPVANDFEALYARCPDIHTVLFNGAAAQALYRRLVKTEREGLCFKRMPSTSPAYTLNSKKKEAVWDRAVKEALNIESL